MQRLLTMYGIKINCNNTSCNCKYQKTKSMICTYLEDNILIQLEYFNNPNGLYQQEDEEKERKTIGTMLNILQSNKIALLNLNHNLLAIQFIAKYKLKQCKGFKWTSL